MVSFQELVTDSDKQALIEDDKKQLNGDIEAARPRVTPSPVSTRLRIEMINEERRGRQREASFMLGSEDVDPEEEEIVDAEEPDTPHARPRRMSEINISEEKKPIPPYSSFFVFKPDNKFRIFCHFVCNHRYFGNIVLVCILVSSAMLAAEDPVIPSEKSDRNKVRKINLHNLFKFTQFISIFV